MIEALKAIFHRSWMPGILTIMVIAGSFGLYVSLILWGNPKSLDDVILGRILGTADMSLGIVLAYWFGSSQGSRSKDETISNLSRQ